MLQSLLMVCDWFCDVFCYCYICITPAFYFSQNSYSQFFLPDMMSTAVICTLQAIWKFDIRLLVLTNRLRYNSLQVEQFPIFNCLLVGLVWSQLKSAVQIWFFPGKIEVPCWIKTNVRHLLGVIRMLSDGNYSLFVRKGPEFHKTFFSFSNVSFSYVFLVTFLKYINTLVTKIL